MDKKILEFTVDLVQAQASAAKMSPEEIENALIRAYNTLLKIRRAEDEGRPVAYESTTGIAESLAGEVRMDDPRSSIQEDKVICLECGSDFRQLTANHLRTHNLTPREYKRKWGFPLKQPLAAKMLTRLRSRSAKKRGLPQKLQQYLEIQREKKGTPPVEEAPPAPRKTAQR